MTNLDTIKLTLTVISGICWTVVYFEGIRVGLRDRSYAIPFYALALNFAWELLHTIYGFRAGASVQTINCSNCGGPIDLAAESACRHCGSPLTILDVKQMIANWLRNAK